MPPKSFALTRWVTDETVSVMPLTAVKKSQTPHVGAFVDVKYLGKFYEAEILVISGMNTASTILYEAVKAVLY